MYHDSAPARVSSTRPSHAVLTTVFEHVFLEVSLVGEGPLAELADERLLPGVGPQVALVVVLAGEAGLTLSALQTALCPNTARNGTSNGRLVGWTLQVTGKILRHNMDTSQYYVQVSTV